MTHHCPACDTALQPIRLERALPAHACPNCQGIWLSAEEYFAWNHLQLTPADLSPEQQFELPYPLLDNNKALQCPDCRRFLRRYQVWPTIDFHLDHCSHCFGVWFDAHEWQTLQSQALHNKLHLFFSDQWQETLRSVEMKQRFEEMYLTRFGAEDYETVKQLRQWFHTHSQGFSLLAYVTDKDPYSG